MKYIDPQITNVLKADSTIQGMGKEGIAVDTSHQPTGQNPGYRADE
jgi:hypothetical protein